MQDKDTLLLDRHIAERLKVSLSTVRHWRDEGIGPPWFTLGTGTRSIRYSERAFEEWLDECKRT